MFALVDCNNFFASAERVFQPGLQHSPICVLSNNDGCVVSLTNEAKAAGIKRGDPLFKIRDIVERRHIAVFSSNYTLYAGMSARVMQILGDAVPDIDVYSIDEAFLHLDGFTQEQMKEKMLQLAQRVFRWTGIPVSIGVAPTRTLAKVAAKYAKKYPGYHHVCLIDTEEKRRKALAEFPIGDVWGIGRQSVKKMETAGIGTAGEFLRKPAEWVKRNFGTPGFRTWNELKGIACIEISEIAEKQSICMSRSFGNCLSDFGGLSESVANFAAEVAQKLRRQHSVANIITVFIRTDRFNTSVPQYSNIQSVSLPVATADTVEIIATAQKILSNIYRKGFSYKKSGVIVSGILSDSSVQQHLFDPVENREKRTKLNRVMDVINSRSGHDTVKFAVQEIANQSWNSRKEFKSRDFLTNIKELMEVHT